MWFRVVDKIRYLFRTGAIHIVLGTFFSKFVTFFGSIVVVRLLSKQEYGLLSYVENIYGYIFIFAGLGLSNAVLRYVVIPDEIEKKNGYYKYIRNTNIFLNSIICIIALVINNIIDYPQEFVEAKKWMPILIVLVAFQDLVNVMLYVFRAFFKNKLYAYLSFAVASSLIVGRMVGAYVSSVGGVLFSRLIINAVIAIMLIILVRNSLFKDCVATTISTEQKKEVNKYSIQYMITNGIWGMFMLNDTLLLSQITKDLDVVADYKVAYVIPGCLSILSTAIGVYVAPYFVKQENDINWIRRNFKKVYVCVAGIILVVTAGVFLFAKQLINILYGETYYNIVPLMRGLLVVSFINCGLRYTIANILAAMGKIKYNMIVSAIGVVMQIVLDYCFILKYGQTGVVYSNIIIYSFMTIVLFVVFMKLFYCRPKGNEDM